MGASTRAAPIPQDDIFRRVARRLESFPPIVTLAVFFTFGVLLVLGSFLAHVYAVTDASTGKQFGYIYEINWGLNFIVFVPLALYFCAAALNSVHQTITRISDSRMIVTEEGRTIDRTRLSAEWRGYARRAIQVWLIVTIIVAVAVAVEWWHSSVLPLSLDWAHVSDSDRPIAGWPVAPHLSGGQVGSTGTLVFGVFAFLAEAAFTSSFVLFVSVIFAFAAWVFRYTNEDVAAELFPNPRSEDLRRGFESFQLFIENLVSASVSLLFVFFMTRLQFAFLDFDDKSVMSFAARSIGKGFFQGITHLLKSGDTELFATGNHLWYSIAMAGSGAALTLITGFLIPTTIVRQAAMRAKDRFLNWAPNHNEQVQNLYNLTAGEAMARLQSMKFWPILYPAPVQLLLFVVLAAGCFVFFKLTLILVGVMLYAGVRQLTKVFSTE